MNIARRAFLGALWTGGANYLSQAVGMLSVAVLGRLLVEGHFGYVATANSIVQFIFILSAFSFNISVIQAVEEKPRFYSTAFVLTLALGVASLLLTVLLGVGTSLLAGVSLFGMAPFRPLSGLEMSIIAALAVVNALNLAGQHFDAILQRNLEFKKISIIAFSMNIANPVVAVGSALLGAGLWSLVLGQLAASILFLAGSWKSSGWRVSMAFSGDTARWFMKMGGRYLGSRALEVVYTELDRIVIKRVTGVYDQVGLYERANLASKYPMKIVSPVISNVALPVYAKLKTNTEQLSDAYTMLTFFLIRIMTVAGLVFLLVPEAFITALLGARWISAAEVLRALAIFAVLYPVVENLKVLFYALGRPETVSVMRIAQIIVYVPLLLVLVTAYGIIGAAYALLESLIVAYAVLLLRLRGVVAFSLFRTAVLPVVFAVATYAAFSLLPVPRFENPFADLAFSGTVIFILYAGCEYLFERKSIVQHIRFIRHAVRGDTHNA